MTEHFIQAKAGYVHAIAPDGTLLHFRPLVNVMKDVGDTVEITIGTATPLIVKGSAAEYLEYLEPTPLGPTPPTDDLTQGKLRINEDGTAIALELPEGDQRGRWRVSVLISELQYYTTDVENPEIASWAYLKVDTED